MLVTLYVMWIVSSKFLPGKQVYINNLLTSTGMLQDPHWMELRCENQHLLFGKKTKKNLPKLYRGFLFLFLFV